MVLAMSAVVIDLGHAYSVRREIQKAADAGASAGARALAYGAALDFANGKNVAVSTVQKNFGDGVLLSDFTADQVQAGYWDLSWTKSTAPANLLGTADPASFVPSATQVPAVKVTITKLAGGSGSNAPVNTYFASVLGIGTMDVATTAVAMLRRSGPSVVPKGGGFPLATPEYWVKQNWDKDPPVSFRIGSTYLDENGGEWTSFLLNANDVRTVEDLIDHGNPTPLRIGDNIWIEPGVKDSVYNYAKRSIGRTVLMPVVPDDFATHATAPILGFAPFYIEDAQNGSHPYIQGHFVKDYPVPEAGEGGPYYGAAVNEAKLVF
jgi:Flp pilus assembly protein TadG